MPCKIREIDPASKPLSSGDKNTARERTEALVKKIASMQDVFYAERRYKGRKGGFLIKPGEEKHGCADLKQRNPQLITWPPCLPIGGRHGHSDGRSPSHPASLSSVKG